MGVYARDNIQREQREEVQGILETGAKLCDMGIFMIVGFAAFSVRGGDGVKFGFLTVFYCLIVRAVMTAVLVPLCNFFKVSQGYKPISAGTAVMIWHSQLRGGLTLLILRKFPKIPAHSFHLIPAHFTKIP